MRTGPMCIHNFGPDPKTGQTTWLHGVKVQFGVFAQTDVTKRARQVATPTLSPPLAGRALYRAVTGAAACETLHLLPELGAGLARFHALHLMACPRLLWTGRREGQSGRPFPPTGCGCRQTRRHNDVRRPLPVKFVVFVLPGCRGGRKVETHIHDIYR